jgi:hypothetical protein
VLAPLGAGAFDPYLETLDAATTEQSPAYRYANMQADAAYAELQARGVLFQREPPTRGVDAPLRLTGRLHGVHVHSALPPNQRPTTPFEVCDARLALALDDFAAILAKHDIDEVVHYSMYRPWSPPAPVRRVAPPAMPASAALPLLPAPSPEARGLSPLASAAPRASASAPAKGRGPTARVLPPAAPRARGSAAAAPAASAAKEAAPQQDGARPATASRHPAALAIDVAKLRKTDGEWLDVAAHFAGRIGARTCGAGAEAATDDKAKELRAVVCEARDARVFTYVLTPNYNAAHRDHFHMEVKAGARWFLYH